jgi:IK cytokine
MLHGPEADQELDAKQVYEQSKYLGGDIQHTHLVKGLDFALLRKVRTDLAKQQQQQQQGQPMDIDEDEQNEAEAAAAEEEEEEQEEKDLDDALERFERGEKLVDDTSIVEEKKPKYRTLMAKNIYDLITNDPPTKVEHFEPGRMAFVFELADEVGHYSDAFAIPTAVIRSKADMNARQQNSWSEEADLVVDKIAQVIRRGGNGVGSGGNATVAKKQASALTSEPVAMVEDGFMGDIFADVGRDYQLDESSTNATMEDANTKSNYFQGLVQEEEEEEDVDMLDKNDEVNALLSQVQQQKQPEEPDSNNNNNNNNNANKRRYHEMVDADAADIDMFGLSSSTLPTSFEEHTTAYQSDDEEDDNTTLQMVDQGTNRNKKAQKTRWDFDTEDEWQNYKDTIEIQPKSAYQFGVKLGDGRKRNRERKPISDKQRLDRDYQQVKNIMSKKYGKSLDQ